MKKLMLVAALAALPMVATLAETKAQGTGPNPFVECGIGAALFPTTAWAAVTSNAIWDLGTTAVTSALSSPETCNAKRMNTASLILNSLEALEADVANGGGATTQALASTMGCAGQEAALVNELRGTMASAVAQPGYATQAQAERANGAFQAVKAAASNAGLSCATAL